MRALAGALLFLCVLAVGPAARAQPEAPARAASRHFQRGVDLYTEGDIRGALVEFKRAYILLPRATVLYNIGQAEYQLQEYASALGTLERFLADTGPNAAHRAEVQQTVEVLRGRVGHIAFRTDQDGCDVTVDDQPAGSTPLAQPLLVSIGRRKLALSCAGSPRVTRDVEVAAGETVAVELRVGASASAGPGLTASAPRTAPGRSRGRGTGAWIAAGGLAVATAATYTAALMQSRHLARLRRTYPITAQQLDDRARMTSRLAVAGDVFAVGTALAAGIASYLRWGSSGGRTVEVSVAPQGLWLQGSF